MYEINKNEWHVCKICNKNIKELAQIYGGSNIYYTTVFKKHLEKDHNLKLEDYFENRPVCKCGVCNQLCDVGGIGKGDFFWKKYKCGRNSGVMKWSEKAKIERCGNGNPMYGKTAWNKDKNKYNNEIMRQKAEKQIGKKTSIETRKKQSESAKKRKVHGHTGCKHTLENKEKSRLRTLQMIKDGVFKQTQTKPHLIMKNILDELNIDYIEEHIVDVWSFDFYIPLNDIYIEVDGDYFHSNPKFYPNGPETKTQRVNYYRDTKKNNFCDKNNMKLIRFWEHDLINNKENVKCKVKELNQ